MKRISALFLSLCILFTFAVPVTAFTPGDLESTIQAIQDTETDIHGPPPDSGGLSYDRNDDGDDTATPTQPNPPGGDLPLGQSGISALSGWEGDGEEYHTRIRLTAADRDGKPIEGVVYGIYRADDDQLVEEIVTDRFGVATSGDLPVDSDYYLLEHSVPDGFEPNPDPEYICLQDNCAPSRIDKTVVYDRLYGQIKIIKTDEDGNLLPNIGFDIKDKFDYGYNVYIETDENGEALTEKIPYGKYEIVEKPQELFAVSDSRLVEVKGEEAIEVEVVNYFKRGNLSITKKGNDDRVISGAVFSLYRAADEEWIADMTTNASGHAFYGSLRLGEYYVVEKSVPAPYELNTEKHFFSITYQGQTCFINLINDVKGDSGVIRVLKTDDSAEPVPLPGVVFGIYRRWDNKKITEITTTEDGSAEYTLLPGDYYLLELSGKPGYTMVSEKIYFKVDGSGATIEKTAVNPKIRVFGKVKAIKKDDAGTGLQGVKIGVYCPAGNLLEELMTGPDGTATSGILNAGDGYYLVEHEGVAGHLADTETRYEFDITQNDVTVPVTIVNPRITGSVKVFKHDGSNNPLAGVVFGIYKNGVKLSEITTGEDGTATSGTLYYGSDYELSELSTLDGYELIETPIPFEILEPDVTVEIPVSNPLILGSVTVVKVDADETSEENPDEGENVSPMAGAVFGLYNDMGQKLSELTVDETGRATYDGLPKSRFFLKELQAPEGFVATDQISPFEIKDQGENVEIVVPNEKGFGTINIIKHGENELLSGVVFEVYQTATGEMLMELTTGENGEISQLLPLGRYYLKEKSTIPGYSLLPGAVSFTLTDDGETVELVLRNQKAPEKEGGRIRIIKRDSADDSILLPGAVFGVYHAGDDGKVEELVTGSAGEAVSSVLPENENGYYLLELVAPVTYQAITEKIPVRVVSAQTTEYVVENTRTEAIPEPEGGRIKIIKRDAADSKIMLPGAVFGVYRVADDKKVDELVTGSTGEAISDELPEIEQGYYLLELVAPALYQAITDKIPVSVKNGETVEKVIENTLDETAPEVGIIEITKRDAADREILLVGAVFGVYLVTDDAKVGELTTDANGNASLTLPVSAYYLKEQTAPKSYKLSEEKIPFQIAANATKKLDITNDKLVNEDDDSGFLRIIKLAEGNQRRRLKGAVFGVYESKSGQKIAELTSDENGEAEMELPVSDYYLREIKSPRNYRLDSSKLPFSIKSGKTVVIQVTNRLEKETRDDDDNDDDVDSDPPTTPVRNEVEITYETITDSNVPPTAQEIVTSLPRTGEPFPTALAVVTAMCFIIAAASGWLLCKRKFFGKSTV